MSLKTFIIEKLKGYSTIESAIEAIKEIDSERRNRILSLAVKRLFNTIGEDDILKENVYGQWLTEGKNLSDAEKNLLIAEAKQFLNSKLWKILQKDVQYQTNRKMFILSKSEIDIIAGKLWTYTLDAFRTRLNSMVKGSGSFNNITA